MIEKSNKKIYKLYFVYLISAVLMVLIRIASALNVFKFISDKYLDLFYSLLIQVFIMFIIPLTLYCLINKVKPKYVFDMCHYKKISVKVILISVAIGVLAFIVNLIVSSFFNGIISSFGYGGISGSGETETITIAQFLLSIFTSAILPAMCEEFMHRGLLLQGSRHIGFKKSILISALCFGLLHYNIEQVFFAFVGGLIMGYVAVVSKNIWPAVIIHFTNNFISCYISFASSRNLLFGNLDEVLYGIISKLNFVVYVMMIALICVGVVIGILKLCKVLYKIQIEDKVLANVQNAMGSVNNILNDESVYAMIQGNTVLNLTEKEYVDPVTRLLPKQKDVYKTNLKDNIFLITYLVLGGIITLFTLIWGFI